MSRKIRFGVSGLGGRGLCWIGDLMKEDTIEVVAATDITPASVEAARRVYPDLVFYNSIGKMLEHDIDAVFVSSPAFKHATDSIAALNAGKHVVSEVTACWTMAEAVALYEAADATDRVYMFGENYCYFPFIMEMKRLYAEGAIGDLLFADCYYYAGYREMWKPFCKHKYEWRNWMPQTYYSSHVVGPLLFATGLRPVEVSGFEVASAYPSRSIGKITDEVAAFTIKLNNGAVANVVSNFMSAKASHLWWHLSGELGEMENDRFGEQLNVVTDEGHKHYAVEPPHSKELAAGRGHGGGDFYVIYNFIRAIRGEAPVPIDVRTGVEMSIPGILAHRSALHGGVKLQIPDMDDPRARDLHRNDTTTPFTLDDRPGDVPPSITGIPDVADAVYVDQTTGDDPDSVMEKLAIYGFHGFRV